jgi:hypothetical protein
LVILILILSHIIKDEIKIKIKSKSKSKVEERGDSP